MYALVRPFLFRRDPEQVHHMTFRWIQRAFAVPGARAIARWAYTHKGPGKTLFGIHFPNPVGLAAGFDKNALLLPHWDAFGFGFVEIGTVTPRPQAGNPLPRLFRLPADQAIINRMGFNNDGLDAIVARLRAHTQHRAIIGGNIGKNKDTPNEQAADDYRMCFNVMHPYVDYFVVNVSSPNTPGLRDLQEKEPLSRLLAELQALNAATPQPRPILLKIAPDLTDTQLDDILDIVQTTGIAGIVATNTTISRDGLQTPADELARIGAGGLSGAPLRTRACAVIRYLRAKAGPGLPIIAVGGIMTPEDAEARMEAGADLVQLYTGFVYGGPSLPKRICRRLARRTLHA
jgi:dihydroorotate dehydrogenase